MQLYEDPEIDDEMRIGVPCTWSIIFADDYVESHCKNNQDVIKAVMANERVSELAERGKLYSIQVVTDDRPLFDSYSVLVALKR